MSLAGAAPFPPRLREEDERETSSNRASGAAMSSIPGQVQGRHMHWRGLAYATMFFISLYAYAGTIGPAAAQAQQGYQIAPGDRIGVTVIGQPDLSGEATVDQGGNLRLPIVGDIRAVNLSPSEHEKSIATSLDQGYVRNPVVSVK